MSSKQAIHVGKLKASEVEEASRIMKLAFGTFLRMPNPLDFMGDRDFMTPRWRSKHVEVIAAREAGRLIGSNVVTRWGSFAFFGPLTVLPEYWDRGVGQRLMEATIATLDRWRVRRSGLFTFAQSPKHIGLYQKFGYWPQSLTALMTRPPESNPAQDQKKSALTSTTMLSALPKNKSEQAIRDCKKITNQIDRGLDLSDEIRSVLEHHAGDVALTYTRAGLDGFAICHNGVGSEGGSKTCYVKFAAVRGGTDAGKRFEGLLQACESFAGSRGALVEAGVNLARKDAYQRMRARGYRTNTLGVAMQRPMADGFNRADVYVVDDWR